MEETRDVLERWAGGDEDAGRELVLRHRALLLRQARSCLARAPGLRMTEKDLVQTAWLRAARGLSLGRFEVRQPGAFGGWLRRILERTAFNEMRRMRTRKREASVLSVFGDESESVSSVMPPSPDPTPTAEARHRDLTAFCRSILGDREWEVWRRVEIDGIRAVDVALELGLSPSAVRALVHRARLKLMHALNGER